MTRDYENMFCFCCILFIFTEVIMYKYGVPKPKKNFTIEFIAKQINLTCDEVATQMGVKYDPKPKKQPKELKHSTSKKRHGKSGKQRHSHKSSTKSKSTKSKSNKSKRKSNKSKSKSNKTKYNDLSSSSIELIESLSDSTKNLLTDPNFVNFNNTPESQLRQYKEKINKHLKGYASRKKRNQASSTENESDFDDNGVNMSIKNTNKVRKNKSVKKQKMEGYRVQPAAIKPSTNISTKTAIKPSTNVTSEEKDEPWTMTTQQKNQVSSTITIGTHKESWIKISITSNSINKIKLVKQLSNIWKLKHFNQNTFKDYLGFLDSDIKVGNSNVSFGIFGTKPFPQAWYDKRPMVFKHFNKDRTNPRINLQLQDIVTTGVMHCWMNNSTNFWNQCFNLIDNFGSNESRQQQLYQSNPLIQWNGVKTNTKEYLGGIQYCIYGKMLETVVLNYETFQLQLTYTHDTNTPTLIFNLKSPDFVAQCHGGIKYRSTNDPTGEAIWQRVGYHKFSKRV